MLGRFEKYLRAKPRRAAGIVATLLVVLILVIAGNLFQLLGLGRYFEPPYLSETTSLSPVQNGVRWDNPVMYQGATYNRTLFYWGNASGALLGHVAFESQEAELSTGSPVTVIVNVAQAADMSYWWNLTIYDSTGDGTPGAGDYIMFTGPPQQSDTVYTVALVYLGPSGGGVTAEVSYALHHGKFYSWVSDTAHTDWPWWYSPGLNE